MPDFSAANIQNDFNRSLTLYRDAFSGILALFSYEAPAQLTPEAFLDALQQIRQQLGDWNKVADRLNLNQNEMLAFTQALRTLIKLQKRQQEDKPASRDLTIAALRFLSQLEMLKEKQPLLTYSTELHGEGEKKQLQSLQQVRAVELMIRSLINEAYRDQQALLNHLQKLFGQERVQAWLRVADRDDILSGTLFSELSSLFVDKNEYAAHYSPLYQYTPLLSFMSDKRKTLITFLDDIRAIRNRLAHHKRVTSVQTALVNYYYEEIAAPVQEAFDEGRVAVNPDRYFDASDAELRRYFTQAAEKLDRLGDDIGEVKDILVEQSEKLDKIKTDTGFLRKNMVWVIAGIAVLIVGSLLTFNTSTRTLVNTEVIRSDVSDVGKIVSGVKKETSSDPRKELANIGIAWDEKNIRDAIDRGDTRVVGLFMDGGMGWKLYYTEKALLDDRQETLALLLQHASLMDDRQGCPRMNSLLRDNVSRGNALTTMQTRFLKTFCSSSQDVAYIKAELDKAVSFEERQKKAYDEEMAKIEPADRCESRLMARQAQPLLDEAARFNIFNVSTLSLYETLLARLNGQLLAGVPAVNDIRKLVHEYCVKQATSRPNIGVSDNWSRAQRAIYNVVK